MSLDLYISESSLVIGTFPMVFLKNTSSIVEGLIERKAGRSNKSFPKRQGWVGYLGDTERKMLLKLLIFFFIANTNNQQILLALLNTKQRFDPKGNSPKRS